VIEPVEWKTGLLGVTPIGGPPERPEVRRPDTEQDGPTFPEMLKRALEEVNQLQSDAGEKMQDLVTGQTDNLHEVMIAVEEAGIALNLTLQVRNKIIQAYEEIMRVQI
jgi:flagellar hook-basal body complex protein FliE